MPAHIGVQYGWRTQMETVTASNGASVIVVGERTWVRNGNSVWATQQRSWRAGWSYAYGVNPWSSWSTGTYSWMNPFGGWGYRTYSWVNPFGGWLNNTYPWINPFGSWGSLTTAWVNPFATWGVNGFALANPLGRWWFNGYLDWANAVLGTAQQEMVWTEMALAARSKTPTPADAQAADSSN
jgi:hypothetical protein